MATFSEMRDAARRELAGLSRDSIAMRTAEFEQVANGPRVAHLVYDVGGEGGRLVVELWLEQRDDRWIVETINLRKAAR
jgi:hypothetical protein